jgi:hypothetical protein
MDLLPPPSADAELAWEQGLAVERQQLTALAGWAGANLVVGGAGALLAREPEARTFHASNAAWNVVNLGIAAAGLAGAAARDQRGFPGASEAERQQRGLRTALAVNVGLDVGYVGGGVALWGVGGEAGEVPLRPVGQSLLLQGGFLLAFDAIFLARHAAATR